MKTIFTLQKLFFCFVLFIGTISVAHAQIVKTSVYIPNTVFKAVLVNNPAINRNGDSEIQITEAKSYTGKIDVSNLRKITDLTGIEAFTALTELDCSSNSLSSLDVSKNIALEVLYCSDNNLSNLDVSMNAVLTTLYCSATNLSSLDVSNNLLLEVLFCSDNNNLSSLNLQNGNNTSFFLVNFFNNPNLTCIQVDNVAYANANFTNKDTWASYSTNCAIVYIPDANFKKALIDNHSIDTNGDSEIQVSEAESYTGTIFVHYQDIDNLTGIEAFTALTALNCYSNNLSGLDVSKNVVLRYLKCSDNNLSSLDLSSNTALTGLTCRNNNLSGLDVSKNVALTSLHCSGNNNLSILDVSKNVALKYLSCGDNNNLSSLNLQNGNNISLTESYFSNNPNLTCIQVDDAAYANANFTNKDAWAEYGTNCAIVYIPDANFKAALVNNLAINTNGDSEIQVFEAEKTGSVAVADEGISDLTGIEAFIQLSSLNCQNNNLSNLDLSQNTVLKELYCNNNKLSSLDLSKNTILTTIICSNNNLSSLDLSQNTVLTHLECSYTYLANLNIQNGNNLNLSTRSFANNINLNCIQVDNVAYANAFFTDKDIWASYSTDCNPTTNTKSGLARITNIYPNPASSVLTIETTEEILSKEVIGLDGLVKLEDSNNKNTLDISSIPSGVYFISIKTQGGVYQDKFVKQ